MNQGWTYFDRVQPAAAGQTVLNYYTAHYRHSTRTQWQQRIARGQVLLDGRPVSEQTPLSQNQRLSYRRAPWQEPAAELNFEVLYEDEELWAIAKPSGLPVLPGGGFLEHTLLHQMRRRYPTEKPVPVHRLGRGTSGVMLVAKSQAARERLSKQFRVRSLSKIYRALIIGPASVNELADSFTCTYPIGKIAYPPLGQLYAHSPSGQAARSDGTVLQRRLTSTLVEVSITTGRPHQIRIHLAAAGYPLWGDPLYAPGGFPIAGGAAMPGDCGYHLHAHRLRLSHPRTGKTLSIVAAPPAILKTAGQTATPTEKDLA
ncbi:MAG: RluA family pseudouridine synthase [Phormidesmis sp.]